MSVHPCPECGAPLLGDTAQLVADPQEPTFYCPSREPAPVRELHRDPEAGDRFDSLSDLN